MTGVAREAGRPRVGHLPTRWQVKLQNWDGDLFTNITNVNNVYLLKVILQGLGWLHGQQRRNPLMRSWSDILKQLQWWPQHEELKA
jgi:hypothetical protein